MVNGEIRYGGGDSETDHQQFLLSNRVMKDAVVIVKASKMNVE
jgi:hypothetical protein